MIVKFPELKDFFSHSITGRAARRLLEAYPTPDLVAAAGPAELHQVVVVQGRARWLVPNLMDVMPRQWKVASASFNPTPSLPTTRSALRRFSRSLF